MYQFRDFSTKKVVTPKSLVFTGETSPWEIEMDIEKIATMISPQYFQSIPASISKYLPLMPIKSMADFIALTTTASPLVKSKSLGQQLGVDLYFKVEGKNPTGSFKDRGSAVEVAVAKEFSAKSMILASTGNMAASCACYAAATQLPCIVLVPKAVSAAKLAQAAAYGARIIQIEGNYNDAAILAKSIAEKNDFYLAGDYAFRVEGQKTAVFELLDQFNWQVPDQIFVPIGCGTNLAAYAKGVREYQQLGFIDKQPKLIGVQAAGADAVVQSYQQQRNTITPLTQATTLASAIAVANPIDGEKALQAIYDSKGCALAVTDEEILTAQYLLAKEEGLFVESASTVTLAALLKSLPRKNERVVCVLTGDGLKDPHVILNRMAPMPVLAPDEDQVINFINKKVA